MINAYLVSQSTAISYSSADMPLTPSFSLICDIKKHVTEECTKVPDFFYSALTLMEINHYNQSLYELYQETTPGGSFTTQHNPAD